MVDQLSLLFQISTSRVDFFCSSVPITKRRNSGNRCNSATNSGKPQKADSKTAFQLQRLFVTPRHPGFAQMPGSMSFTKSFSCMFSKPNNNPSPSHAGRPAACWETFQREPWKSGRRNNNWSQQRLFPMGSSITVIPASIAALHPSITSKKPTP